MGNVAKMSATNAGDCDYKAAINRLEWAVYHAEQMGFVVPVEVTAALLILRGQACVTYFSNASASPTILCVGRPETDEDFDDHMEMVMFVLERLKQRRERHRKQVGAAIVGLAQWSAQPMEARQGEDGLPASSRSDDSGVAEGDAPSLKGLRARAAQGQSG